jgi:hypothetical protein
MEPARRQRILVILLRIGGGMTVTAFLAVFLPIEWMATTHRWLGLGEFPRAPIVDYLARSTAAFYGFHGVLLFIISSDPVRYRGIVRYAGAMSLILGVMLVFIDVHAGMPLYWILGEGPPVIAIGATVLYLMGDPPSR